MGLLGIGVIGLLGIDPWGSLLGQNFHKRDCGGGVKIEHDGEEQRREN